MDLRKLKKLIELVEESDIDELEISEKDTSVRIRRRIPAPMTAAYGVAGPAGMTHAGMPPAVGYPAGIAFPGGAAAPQSGTGAGEASPEATPVETGHVVTSPMVGTFYRAPSPTSSPFVDIGQRVAVGDTLGIIEAMKILNPIESDVSGVVSSVLVENGRAVEYGEPLFVVTPD
ncbi:MAG: acetyl-CoA carboxylase biotin carboxyl carrier protein [Gammaproteobacteria bacterium]|nr:acetyl-CoA carboxylase biotin carboxyl carrier protein [Gammaproteobacteria bacterium]